MQPDDEQRLLAALDDVVERLREVGGDLPLSEETIELMWQRLSPVPASASFKARMAELFAEPAEAGLAAVLGAKLADLRGGANFSIESLAKKLGVQRRSVEQLESGNLHPADLSDGFWVGFARTVGRPGREVIELLRPAEQLHASSFGMTAGRAEGEPTDAAIDQSHGKRLQKIFQALERVD